MPSTADNESNKIKRKLFVQKLLEYNSNETPVIFIDETNFNIFNSRTIGRSAVGSRANKIDPNSKGKNLHLIGAIGTNGFKNFETRRGSFTSELANDYLRRVVNLANCFYAGCD